MRFPLCPVVREKRPRLRQRAQDGFKLGPKTDDARRAGFLAAKAHHPALPVDVLRRQVGDIALRRAQMPAALIIGPALRVVFGGHNRAVLFPRDRPLFLEADLWPALLGQNRPRQPCHIEREVVQPSQEDVRGYGPRFDRLEQMRRLRFRNRQVPDEVERLLSYRAVMTCQRHTRLGLGHLIHDRLPGEFADLWVCADRCVRAIWRLRTGWRNDSFFA